MKLTIAPLLACLVMVICPDHDGRAEGQSGAQGSLGKQELGLAADVPSVAGTLRSPAHFSYSEIKGGTLLSGDGSSGPVSNRFDGALDLGDEQMMATFSSTVESMHDPFQAPIQTSTVSHSVLGALRPSREFKIEPSLRLSRYHEQWTGLRMESPSATLGLTYTPSRAWSYRLGGGYTESIFPGAGNRSNTVSANSGITLQLKEGRSVAPSLSIDTNYSQTTEAYRDSDPMRNFGGTLRLHIPIN
jgi:hypothetical protein